MTLSPTVVIGLGHEIVLPALPPQPTTASTPTIVVGLGHEIHLA
jgi:hypothetical protein